MQTTLENDRFIKALLRQPVKTTPIWIMRQAGRYLPEYRKLRQQAGDFLNLCKTPELACEVTLQPLRRFALDAAIIFSDILTIPDAMGLGLHFIPGEGPKFARPITHVREIKALPVPDPATELVYVTDAIALVHKALQHKVPLIGFAGSPWTLATYMIEGGASKTFSKIKALLYQDPASLHLLLEKLTAALVLYLNAQIKAGANVVQIFDTWGGILTPQTYQQFSLHYSQQILTQLIRKQDGHTIPRILFTKNSNSYLAQMAYSACDAIGLDWTINIESARKIVGDKITLQGNLDPAVLYAPPDTIRAQAKAILQCYGAHPGHVFNLGHGIAQDVNPEHVAVLVDAVHEFSTEILCGNSVQETKIYDKEE